LRLPPGPIVKKENDSTTSYQKEERLMDLHGKKAIT